MGCSNPHPNSQIWSQSQLPNEITKEFAAQRDYFNQNHRRLLVDYVQEEHKQTVRTLFSNDHFTVVVPFWAVWPFEVLVFAHRPAAYLKDMNASEVSALADMVKRVTTRYDNLFEISFPYSMGFHQAPADMDSRIPNGCCMPIFIRLCCDPQLSANSWSGMRCSVCRSGTLRLNPLQTG